MRIPKIYGLYILKLDVGDTSFTLYTSRSRRAASYVGCGESAALATARSAAGSDESPAGQAAARDDCVIAAA